jgi:hypothetical protein
MAQYRAYAITNEGHIVRRFEFEAESDERAMEQARTHLDGLDIEVWEHKRVVGKLRHRHPPDGT